MWFSTTAAPEVPSHLSPKRVLSQKVPTDNSWSKGQGQAGNSMQAGTRVSQGPLPTGHCQLEQATLSNLTFQTL